MTRRAALLERLSGRSRRLVSRRATPQQNGFVEGDNGRVRDGDRVPRLRHIEPTISHGRPTTSGPTVLQGRGQVKLQSQGTRPAPLAIRSRAAPPGLRLGAKVHR